MHVMLRAVYNNALPHTLSGPGGGLEVVEEIAFWLEELMAFGELD